MAYDLVKIEFPLDQEEWHNRPSETLWAAPVQDAADPGGAYILQNSPFFINGISYLDVVRAVPRSLDHKLDFAGLIDSSGHSTFMLLVPPKEASFFRYWEKLERLGCTYEWREIKVSLGPRILYSVDVPTSANLDAARAILNKGVEEDVWMYQVGKLGQKTSEGH